MAKPGTRATTRAPRQHADSPRKPGFSFASVLQRLQTAAQQRPVLS
jgi:hypothetical protein